eukprot:CAMPEP_0184655840 /NCGR_PEP_ID=MMETSP0308-20130426/14589_1 /TAXON_ID=38269 /ORGANISM="Gloeochaete witrockiana, Strain SAG 46.84" /LENGTH=150 /DNA_ID=CAMNT_0027092617 /DNA_START=293 /DNA_END=745 /DNA_ORIENTATION=+
MVKVNEPAPDFEGVDQNGKTVKLSDYKGVKNVVVFFYPQDATPGCTQEVCSFRDSYEAFQNQDTEVIGISSDGIESHQKFASQHGLPFSLVSDPQKAIRKAYGVPSAAFGFLPGRVTYVIDKTGVVRLVYDSLLNASAHPSESLKIVKQI